MNWEVKRMDECCLSISDGDHLPPPKADKGVPFITITNIDPVYNTIDFSDTMFVPEDYFCSLQEIRKPREGDILYSVVGSFGIPVLIGGNHNFTFQRHIAILRPNQDVVIPEYLYYVMKSRSLFAQADSYAIGSAQRTISLSSLRKMKIPVPDLPEQKRLASVLSAYDNLIKSNNRRMNILEQMAENLYKEWFVRFRFPGHVTTELVGSKIGSIPASFSVVRMQDVFEYYIGGGWGNDDEDNDFPIPAYVIRGTDFPHVKKGDLSTCPLRYHKESNFRARQLQPDDIILEVSGGTAEQPVGRTLLVTTDTIDRLGGKVICASFCKQIRVKRKVISPYYFYYWMQFLYDTRIIDRFQLQSTGITNFQFEYFTRKCNVLLPTKAVMEEFDLQIKPIFDEISAIAKQNENLIKQRDLLLPRLMSKKLEV